MNGRESMQSGAVSPRPTEPGRRRGCGPVRAVAVGLLVVVVVLMLAVQARAAGTLTPVGANHAPIQIRDHHLSAVINNGFARMQVRQTFFNPNDRDLGAIYACPVPQGAALSEVIIQTGELELRGEVIERGEAERVYKEERDQGKDAGLAAKNDYRTFEFAVSPVRANAEVVVTYVYYQSLSIDTAVGRLVYPLESGGTDVAAEAFWTLNQRVEGMFSADIELKSAVAVADIRVPNVAGAVTTQVGEGHYRVKVEQVQASLTSDLVVYYRLADNLPGRVEVIPYRQAGDKPGTFMAVLTPGVDLKPLSSGADYVFVLDVSGSMAGKIQSLVAGVERAIGSLRPDDRFRVITFSDTASDLLGGMRPATPEEVARAIAAVKQLVPQSGTNLYAGLEMAVRGLDADRASSVVMVTDGVTNTGVVDPASFDKLMKKYDVRVFGFLMGNEANWPLMRVICDASGGFYASVSNQDDIVGQLVLARSKITHEAMHDVKVSLSGVRTFDLVGAEPGKLYRGQQLVIFGRYEKPGRAKLTLDTRITGESKRYVAEFDLPEVDTDNPELERLWAMRRVEQIEAMVDRGQMDQGEARGAIVSIGVDQQIVTDHTAMLVLADSDFERHGIERRNKERSAAEQTAQAARANAPVRDYRVDHQQPAFPGNAPGVGGGNGGGAIDPVMALLIAGAGAAGLLRRQGRRAA